jgi:hypothetical protein
MPDNARYIFSTVRVVPDPGSGEFANIAAIAGSDETGDWIIRGLQNEQRVRQFCGPYALEAAHDFISRVGFQIDWSSFITDWDDLGDDAEGSERVTEKWLSEIADRQHRVVQLSSPRPIMAASASAALDLVFEHTMPEPEKRTRVFTKWALVSSMQKAYRRAGLERNVSFVSGATLETQAFRYPIDFVVTSESHKAVQITQMWSFRTAAAQEHPRDIKAWGWTLEKLRSEGGTARGRERLYVEVPPNVDIEVIVVPPEDEALNRAYEEALAVFSDVNAHVNRHGQEQLVADKGAKLLGLE